MKKNFILMSLVLVGCHQSNPDFIALESVIVSPGTEVIGVGAPDTAFIRIPASPEITAFANTQRTVAFWTPLSDDNIVKYAQPGFCIVNAKLDHVGNCPYRIYCGMGEMLNMMIVSNINYAVEICR